jgi:predicted O-methyltransferase YrrM
MKIGKSRGSYLPILIKLVQNTSGPILELGVGFCSTPFLHWVCYPTKRRLVSYENNPEYYKFAESWKDDFHEIRCINNWDEAVLDESWTIAFVDHSPSHRRAIEIKKLLQADYIVAHDTENRVARDYGYPEIEGLFRYRYKYRDAHPHTSIYSNKYNIRNFKI